MDVCGCSLVDWEGREEDEDELEEAVKTLFNRGRRDIKSLLGEKEN